VSPDKAAVVAAVAADCTAEVVVGQVAVEADMPVEHTEVAAGTTAADVRLAAGIVGAGRVEHLEGEVVARHSSAREHWVAELRRVPFVLEHPVVVVRPGSCHDAGILKMVVMVEVLGSSFEIDSVDVGEAGGCKDPPWSRQRPCQLDRGRYPRSW